MSYLPDGMPAPVAGPDDALFWEACRRRELVVAMNTGSAIGLA